LRSLEIGEMRIPISEIRQGVQDFKFTMDLPGLQVGMAGVELHMADVRAHVTMLGDDFLVEIAVENEGDFVCDRCGEPHRKSIQGKVNTLFVSAANDEPREGNDEVRILPQEARAIDILQDAVDALLLAVPVKILCKESCMGLCPSCGKNLNDGPCSCTAESGDSRWDALKNIKFGS
jgi:uncharacterized protein